MDSRERKISENIGLVHACAKRFKTRGVEYDDLFQAGCLAVDHFDETRGLRFSTYAVPVILGEMRRLFRDGGSIKVGRSLKELSLRAGRAAAEYTKLHGRSPTINELAALLGVEITEAAQAVGAGEEEGGGQIDVPVEGPDEKISELLSLKQVIGELEPRDRSIIIFRYFQSRTQTQTAEALGMTQVQVSRREKAILKGLRDKLSE